MTLAIQTEEDEQRQLKVTVEVPENRVQSQMRRTARNLARQVNIPGFRRGKAPYNVLVRRVGEEALRADAIEEMLESIVVESLEEIEVTPFRQPSLDDMEINPFIIKLTVPLEPKVTLVDYRSVRKEVKPVEVTQETLNESLDHIRSHHQILEEVERPAEKGDLVSVSGEGKIDDTDGEVIWHEDGRDMLMDPEKVFPGTPFIESIVGMSAGEEKEFRFAFPQDFEDEELAGKSAIFLVTVTKVQSRELPELDDELAKKEGDYESLEELTEDLRKELQEEAERQAKGELMDEFIEDVRQQSEVVFPPAVVESELESRLQNLKDQVTQSGWQWKDWLTLQTESEESLKESWREDAIESVTNGLILGHIIEAEMIKVEPADVDQRVDKLLDRFGDNEDLKNQLRSIYTQGQGLQSISNDILMEKAQDRILAIITGVAPDLEASSEEEISDEEE